MISHGNRLIEYGTTCIKPTLIHSMIAEWKKHWFNIFSYL